MLDLLNFNTVKKSILRYVFPSVLLVSLSGCVGLEVAHLVAQVANNAISDLVSAERMTVVSNDLESATPANYKPFTFREGQDCRFSSFMIPYARTWPEEVRQNEQVVRVLPPEPRKVAGYIAVIYKKTCPNADPVAVLRAGRQSTITGQGTIFTRAFSEDKTTYFMNSRDGAISSQDMTDPGLTNKPLWWSQVVQRMVRLAQTDIAVKAVLKSNLDLFVAAAPEEADSLRAVAQ